MTDLPDTTAVRRDLYGKVRAEYTGARQSSFEQLDKAILTLSTAALGFSFAFLGKLAGSGPVAHTGVLVASWWCFAAAIIATLGSFGLSIMSVGKQLRIAERYYLKEDDDAHKTPNNWTRATYAANGLASLAFVVGVVCSVGFATANLNGLTGGSAAMSKAAAGGGKSKSGGGGDLLRKGYTPSQMPQVPAPKPSGGQGGQGGSQSGGAGGGGGGDQSGSSKK